MLLGNKILTALVSTFILACLSTGAVAQTGAGTSNNNGLFSKNEDGVSDYRSTGFLPFSILGVRSILQENGFQILGDEYSEEEQAHLFAATAADQPIIFILQDCQADDCIFLKMILPMAYQSFSVNLSDSQILSLSGALPFGYLMPEKSQSGMMSLRYGMPMAKECARECLISNIGMFFAEASAVQQALLMIGASNSAANDGLGDEKFLAELQHNYHYEALRVESGLRAAELTGMNDFLGTMALRSQENVAAFSVTRLAGLGDDMTDLLMPYAEIYNVMNNDYSGGWVLYPPMGHDNSGHDNSGDENSDLGVEFRPLFEQE